KLQHSARRKTLARRVGIGGIGLAAILLVAMSLRPGEGDAIEAPPPPAPALAETEPQDAGPPAPPAEEERRTPRQPSTPPPAAAPTAQTAGATTAGEAEEEETPLASREVQLRWVPQGAVLYVDGARVDTVAPTWTGTLEEGEHRIALL